MSYYIGFRMGWVRVLGHSIGWSDPTLYPTMPGRQWRAWRVWFR